MHPTSQLVAAVDSAHPSTDPFAALTAWKRNELAAWRTHDRSAPDLGFAHSPVLWGALADFEDPDRGSPPWPATPRARDPRP